MLQKIRIKYIQLRESNDFDIFEEPYYSFPNMRNSPHFWKFEFNKQTGALYLR